MSPRPTIRSIVDKDPTSYVILLAWLSGVAGALASMTARSGQHEFPLTFYVLLALYMGPPMGFVHTYTGGALTRMTGGWLGGRGSFAECRAALAWGGMPQVWALPIWAVGLAVFGMTLVREHDAAGDAYPWLLAFLVTHLGLLAWSMVLQVACIAEVHGFSTGRGLATALLAWLVFIGSLIALMLAAMAFDKPAPA